MLEAARDLWSMGTDVICITTNGTVISNRTTGDRQNVMGGGCALEARQRHPVLPGQLARLIDAYGNHVFLLERKIVAFPTKEDVSKPSTMERISKSVDELLVLADLYGWTSIALPRPGAGLGGLNWDDVRPVLAPRLDDRFIIVSYPTRRT